MSRIFEFHRLYWPLILISAVLEGTYEFVNPGGAFISLFHSIIPGILQLTCLWVVFYHYLNSSVTQRVVRILYAGIAIALLIVTVLGTYYLMRDSMNRGHLFGI